MNPQELKSIMGSGLLSFPLTDFDAEGNFDTQGYMRAPRMAGALRRDARCSPPAAPASSSR